MKNVADDISRVTLDDLAPSSLVVIRPIPVTVQQEDGVYLASFSEANVNASGETVAEALDMLKDMIGFTYNLLSDEESVLAAGPKNQLAALRRFVRN